MKCPICKKRAEIIDYLGIGDEIETYWECRDKHEITVIHQRDLKYESYLMKLLEAKNVARPGD